MLPVLSFMKCTNSLLLNSPFSLGLFELVFCYSQLKAFYSLVNNLFLRIVEELSFSHMYDFFNRYFFIVIKT